jgi:hypothetical protein
LAFDTSYIHKNGILIPITTIFKRDWYQKNLNKLNGHVARLDVKSRLLCLSDNKKEMSDSAEGSPKRVCVEQTAILDGPLIPKHKLTFDGPLIPKHKLSDDKPSFSCEIDQVHFSPLDRNTGDRKSVCVNIGFSRSSHRFTPEEMAALEKKYGISSDRPLANDHGSDSNVLFGAGYKPLVPAFKQLIEQSPEGTGLEVDITTKFEWRDQTHGKRDDKRVHIWVHSIDPLDIEVTKKALYVLD